MGGGACLEGWPDLCLLGRRNQCNGYAHFFSSTHHLFSTWLLDILSKSREGWYGESYQNSLSEWSVKDISNQICGQHLDSCCGRSKKWVKCSPQIKFEDTSMAWFECFLSSKWFGSLSPILRFWPLRCSGFHLKLYSGGRGWAREVRASGGAFTGGSTPHLQPMMSPMMFMMVKMLMLAIVWMLKIPSDSVVGQLNKDKIQGVFLSGTPPKFSKYKHVNLG